MKPPDQSTSAAPRTLRLEERVIPDPPVMDTRLHHGTFRFVLVLVGVAALVMSAACAVNVVADPYGTLGTQLFPTVVTSDRTVKADRVERLERPPELVLLGSSRSMRYEPAYLEEKTGLRAFNAGLNGVGGTADAWAMVRLIHDTWPRADPEYLWLLDVESFAPFEVGARTAGEPRLVRYIDQGVLGGGPAEMARSMWRDRATLLSLDTTYDASRVLLHREEAVTRETRYRRQILADGVLKPRDWSAREWKRRWPQSVKRYSELHGEIYEGLDATAQDYFERALAVMNRRGKTPVVALTPLNPKLHRILAPLGWEERHAEVVAYVGALRDQYDLVLLDMTDPRVFGFDRREWYDGVHMTTVNTRRAIDHILAETGGWPTAQPAED